MKPKPRSARVIRDPSDATKDYFIPQAEADALYKEGRLAWDATNNCYTEHK